MQTVIFGQSKFVHPSPPRPPQLLARMKMFCCGMTYSVSNYTCSYNIYEVHNPNFPLWLEVFILRSSHSLIHPIMSSKYCRNLFFVNKSIFSIRFLPLSQKFSKPSKQVHNVSHTSSFYTYCSNIQHLLLSCWPNDPGTSRSDYQWFYHVKRALSFSLLY